MDVRREQSEIKHEEAVVTEAEYHSAKTTLEIELKGESGGAGASMGGGLSANPKQIPETFKVTFAWVVPKDEVTTFCLQGQELYDTLVEHIGKRVLVSYQEIQDVSYHEGRAVRRRVVGYVYRDVTLVEDEEPKE